MTNTITLSEFISLTENAVWDRKQTINFFDSMVYDEGELYENSPAQTKVLGSIVLETVCGNIKITNSVSVDYIVGDEDSIRVNEEYTGEAWKVEGVDVLDDDGDVMTSEEIHEYLDYDFSNVDTSSIDTNINVDA